jgi:cytochrome P450
MANARVVYEPFGRDTWRDPFTVYRRLRDEDPIHESPHGFWVLTRFQHVLEAVKDTATFSSARGLTFQNERELLNIPPTIVMMDPPDHTRYRRLVDRGFTPRRTTELEPDLRRLVIDRIETLKRAGEGDFVTAVARTIPSWVVAHYLGVPEADRHRFEGWTHAFVQANAQGHGAGVGAALGDLVTYFSELVDRRRREPGDDLVSVLLHADDDGAGIGLPGILGYAFVMSVELGLPWGSRPSTIHPGTTFGSPVFVPNQETA